MRYLLNSAVIAAGAFGEYRYERADEDDLRIFCAAPYVIVEHPEELANPRLAVVSRIGYPETAKIIEDILGGERRVVISRESSLLDPGDIAMVVRLKYRVEPRKKGSTIDDSEAWEIGRLERLS